MTRSLPAALTLGISMLAGGCGMRPAMAEGDSLRPGPYDPFIAKFVEFTVEKQHFSTPSIDDPVSEAWLAAYLDSLDPQRWFFLAGDIAEFQAKYGTKLDDDLAAEARLDAAFEIFTRYQQRLGERFDAARTIVEQPFDFTVAETFRFDREDAEWPATSAEADDLWRRYVKNELIAARLNDKDEAEAIDTLVRRWDRTEKAWLEMEAADVREMYLNALTTTFDPHSNYWKPASNEDFQIDLANQLEGIGAVLTSEDGYTQVRELVPGGPAQMSGKLDKDDRIIAVAQGASEPVDIVDMRLDKVVNLIRGPKGSEVRLTVIPAGADSSERKVVTLVRDKVELKERVAKSTVHEIEHEGRTVKLGVVELPTFYTPNPAMGGGPDASEDIAKLLEELKAQDVQGVVLDLRFNGGGSLTEAVEIGGLFVDKGPMVQVSSPLFPTEVLKDPDPKVQWGGPLVVLTSPASASASEIVAGAVQDYGRGLVVGGETTHGKGTVQTLVPLDQLLEAKIGRKLREPVAGALKLTTQKFYRVSGASTQFRGVESDIVLPTPYDGLDIYESDLDNALPWDEIPATRYKPVGSVADLLPQLQERSKARIAADEEFADLMARLEWRESKKDRKEVSLVLTEREAEAAEYEARFGDKTEEEAAEELMEAHGSNGGDEEEGPDPMRDEALRILADYIQFTS